MWSALYSLMESKVRVCVYGGKNIDPAQDDRFSGWNRCH